MSDLDPSRQPRVPSFPAPVEAPPAPPAAAAAAPEGLFTRDRQVVFLEALAATGAVRAAAAQAGVSHQTAYRERLASPVFARAWSAALVAARVHAEEVLSCRAIDGVEEQVWYHGEVVATRRRYDSRLLLAHLARLDRLTADAKVEAFAGDFEAALGRFGEGSDAPEKAPRDEAEKNTPGQWSTWSTRGPAPCPDCGGNCLGPEDELTEDDCEWLGNRFERMEAERPEGAKGAHQFAGFAAAEVQAEQLLAFEEGVDEWWLVVPARPGDEPDVWHFAEQAGAGAGEGEGEDGLRGRGGGAPVCADLMVGGDGLEPPTLSV